jgi:putative chitobiose transport system substrate-binding protein
VPAPPPTATLSRRDAIATLTRGLAGAVAALTLPACAPRDPSTLTLWTLALRPWFDGYIRERLAAFEAAHPGLRVDWADVPFDALERKLIAAAAAGRAPDVINMSDLNFARFASLGAFAPIAAPPSEPAPADRYLPSALDLCRLPQPTGPRALMGLPWYLTPQITIVNHALLAKANLTPETLATTWSGLLDQAPAFRAATGKHLFSQPLGEESQLPIMLLAEGIPVVQASGLYASSSPLPLRANLTHPPLAAYLARWVDAFRKGHLPRDAGTTGHAHLTRLYQDADLAVISTGPSFLKRIANDAPAVYADTSILSGTTGRLGRPHMPVMVLAVGSQSPRPADAARLAWFLTSPESQTAFAKLVPIMPSTRASLADPFFTTPPANPTLVDRARLLSARSLDIATAFTAALDTWPDLRRAFEDAMKRVLLDDADLPRTLASLNDEWNTILSSGTPAGMDAIPTPAPAISGGSGGAT